MNETLNNAVKDKVKAKYLERFDEFTKNLTDKKEEIEKVIDLNQEVLDVLEMTEHDSPNIKEAKESFKQVIEMSKNNKANTELKLEAAARMRERVEANKSINVLDFLVDFDKIAGQ